MKPLVMDLRIGHALNVGGLRLRLLDVDPATSVAVFRARPGKGELHVPSASGATPAGASGSSSRG